MDIAGALLTVIAAVAYAGGRRRLARRGRSWPTRRTVPWVGGVAVFTAATQPPLAALESRSLSAHVVQHVALGMLAPMLFALGAPVTLALQAASRPTKTALLRLLHSRPVAVVSHPVLALVVFGGSLYVVYLTELLEITLRNDLLHAAVHLHFVSAGCLFFWGVLAVDPVRWRVPHPGRILLALLTVPLHAVLGLAVTGSTELLAEPFYEDHADQELAGALLWLTGDLLGLAAVAVVLAQWTASDRREARREDAEAARQHDAAHDHAGAGGPPASVRTDVAIGGRQGPPSAREHLRGSG